MALSFKYSVSVLSDRGFQSQDPSKRIYPSSGTKVVDIKVGDAHKVEEDPTCNNSLQDLAAYLVSSIKSYFVSLVIVQSEF